MIKAAHEYADRLKALSEKVKDTLYLVMRVYFENHVPQLAGKA